jgi:hypothetical protein
VARCKLWVQSADWNTNLRADRIVALRLWPGASAEESGQLCHLEAITADEIADPSRRGVRLCSASRDVFIETAMTDLMKLIAEHIDSRFGGIIDCCDEETADEAGIHGLFNFTPFREPPEPPGDLGDFFGGKAAQPPT